MTCSDHGYQFPFAGGAVGVGSVVGAGEGAGAGADSSSVVEGEL
ncbi:hypothetical protein [Pseudarthrobacter sp. NamB4]|nr:hypothetical protein [Pseudarthrobacter sp. NamB4]